MIINLHMVDVMMPRVDILAVDTRHHLEHVPDDVDDVDYNHNVRRGDAAVVVRGHTYAAAVEDVVVDSMDYGDVASPRRVYAAVPPMPDVLMVVAAYQRAYAYRCRMDVEVPAASDTPYDVVAAVSLHHQRRPLRHRPFSQDSYHYAYPLRFHKKLSLLVRVTSMPNRPNVPPSHVPMVHHCRFALILVRAMKRTCYIQFCYVYDSLAYQVGGILPFAFHNVSDHLVHCVNERKNLFEFPYSRFMGGLKQQ